MFPYNTVAAAKQIQEECLIAMLSNNNKGKVQWEEMVITRQRSVLSGGGTVRLFQTIDVVAEGALAADGHVLFKLVFFLSSSVGFPS